MKKRRLVIGLLIMAAFIVSSGTFAYWASNVNGPADETTTGSVTIGEAKDATTSFVLTGNTTTGGDLVPANQLNNSKAGAVDNVTLSYDVQWTEDNTTSQLDGTTSTAPITVNSAITITDANGNDVTSLVGYLITVTPNSSNATELTLDGAVQTYTFDVTMAEPADQEEYNAVVNGTITVTITYSLGTITTTDNQ
ncbi:hypothetical protein [Haloplasma contractile]|uniref:Uncharacterized protein n=1 Tax=Haloplasma contractile SSD-17B TaxID=1033810 RepID=U2FK80_9MOLU|nr:hypothetical protein [Haloplasma contractile]ERJ11639.1 hypothetical protein HLPCO_002340 [Haloplasma contractile SSD-17B]